MIKKKILATEIQTLNVIPETPLKIVIRCRYKLIVLIL